jgi:uncharacterized protein YjbJ (UPF0337 family)
MKQFAGSARERWGILTDDDFKTAAGKKENPGWIQERYGREGGSEKQVGVLPFRRNRRKVALNRERAPPAFDATMALARPG